MNAVNVSKVSWHYRFHQLVSDAFGFDPANNLCPYLRRIFLWGPLFLLLKFLSLGAQVFLKTKKRAFTSIAVILIALFLHNSQLDAELSNTTLAHEILQDLSFLWGILWKFAALVAFLVACIVAFVLLIIFVEHVPDWLRRAKKKVTAASTPSFVRLVVTWIKDKSKGAFCRGINVVD